LEYLTKIEGIELQRKMQKFSAKNNGFLKKNKKILFF